MHVLNVIGGHDLSQQLVELGCRVSGVVSARLIGKVSDPEILDRLVVVAEAAKVDEWVAGAQHIDFRDPINRVVAHGEFGQLEAAEIARALRLPFRPRQLLEKVYDKLAMRRALRDEEPWATAAPAASTNEVIEFGTAEGWPVIVKPRNGAGSRDVSLLRDAGDVASLESLPRSFWCDAMVETFQVGTECSVEALSEEGQHRILAITEKILRPGSFVESGHIIPLRASEDQLVSMAEHVRRTLDTLGLMDGPSHTEVIVGEDSITTVETHVRMGGDQIPALVELATGIDFRELVAKQDTGEHVLGAVPDRPPAEQTAAIRFIETPSGGRLVGVSGIAAARAVAGVRRVEIVQELGARIPQGLAKRSEERLAYAISAGERNACLTSTAEALAHIVFEWCTDETENGDER